MDNVRRIDNGCLECYGAGREVCVHQSRSDDNWGAQEWRQPAPGPEDTTVVSEHGRILNKVDYRSHSYKLVRDRFSGYALLVRHGGGDERVYLGYDATTKWEKIFKPLDSDSRYLLLSNLLSLFHETKRNAGQAMAQKYKLAFAEGRLKKRKARGRDTVKVWIEAPPAARQAS